MDEHESTAKTLTFEQLAQLRDQTELISQFLFGQLQAHLDTLRPLFSPRRLFGKYVSGKDEVAGADKLFAQLQKQFQEVCGKPFSLPAELDKSALPDLDGRVVLYPWEYTYEATNQKETKVFTMTSPVRWVVSYSSGYTLAQLRQVLTSQQERRSDYVRLFVLSALVMGLFFEKFPGLSQLLTDLRYEIRTDMCPGLGALPLVTITSCLPSFRPADTLILMAARFSGVPAFIELVDVDAVEMLQDPLKLRIEAMLRQE